MGIWGSVVDDGAEGQIWRKWYLNMCWIVHHWRCRNASCVFFPFGCGFDYIIPLRYFRLFRDWRFVFKSGLSHVSSTSERWLQGWIRMRQDTWYVTMDKLEIWWSILQSSRFKPVGGSMVFYKKWSWRQFSKLNPSKLRYYLMITPVTRKTSASWTAIIGGSSRVGDFLGWMDITEGRCEMPIPQELYIHETVAF